MSIDKEVNYDYEDDLENSNNSKSINSSAKNSGSIYYEELLEKIVFDPQELNVLKKTITDLSIGLIKPHQLKKLILKSYIRIFEEIGEFIPFYFEQELRKRAIHPKLSEEILEKDKLLEELGERINRIYLNLKEKVQGFSNV
ncbi:MAG: hypothetical protein ACFFDK_05185 [Promethearchaeota archaeon]